MKIAFLEYQWNIRAGGEINFILGWKRLLENENQIDFIQYSSNKISSEIKHIGQVDIQSYDIIIVNSVYSSEIAMENDGKVFDFLYYCSKLNRPLLVMNHTRYEAEDLGRLYIVNKLMELATVSMSYFSENEFYKSMNIVCYHLNLDYFYKPFELHDTLLDKRFKDYDLVWANNLVPAKHPEKFIDFAIDNKDIFKKTAMLGYRDYSTDTKVPKDNLNNLIRQNKSINYLGQDFFGSIDLYPFTADFGQMQKFYARSKFSVQLNASFYNNYKIIEEPWGIEGAALESIITGCVPILDIKSKDYVIDNCKLKDYKCCVFLDNTWSKEKVREELQKAVDNYDKLYENCLLFAKVKLRNTERIKYNVSKVLIECINRYNHQDIRDLSKLCI